MKRDPDAEHLANEPNATDGGGIAEPEPEQEQPKGQSDIVDKSTLEGTLEELALLTSVPTTWSTKRTYEVLRWRGVFERAPKETLKDLDGLIRHSNVGAHGRSQALNYLSARLESVKDLKNRHFEEANASAKEAQPLILAALGVSGFTMVSAYSIRDCDLLSRTGSISLALLGVSIPPTVFFVSAPIFLLLLFLYVHVHMRRAVEDLPRYVPVRHWPLSDVPCRPRGSGFALSAITNLIVWGTWPAVSLLLAWKLLPLDDTWLGPLHVTLAGVAAGASLWNFHRVRYRGTKRWNKHYLVLAWGAVFVACLGTYSLCTRGIRGSSLPTQYADFKSADLGGMVLTQRNLTGANFARSQLPLAELDYANLGRATFAAAELDDTRFCGANLFRASFRGANARRARFRCGAAPFQGVASVDFTDAKLNEVNLDFSVVRRLRSSDLTNAKFWSADLFKADLSYATLTNANFSEAHAAAAVLEGARGTRPNFYRADLYAANLRRASLENANFQEAHLMDTNLNEASLRGASLGGAKLDRADLRGCDLSEARGTGTASWHGAKYDDRTKFPKGFSEKIKLAGLVLKP